MTSSEHYQIKPAKYKARLTTGTFGHRVEKETTETSLNIGVAGGVRTLGHWNHNPALYRLSYSHRNTISLSSTANSSTELQRRLS